MLKAIKTGIALLALFALAGCAAPTGAQSSNTPACMQLGTSGGVIPAFTGEQQQDGFARYTAWLYANPPCIPSSWVPQGCSLTVISGDNTAFPAGRYPYNYLASGFYPDPTINTTMGIQAMRCKTGLRVLWWNRVSYQAGVGSFYHETSAIVPVWSAWHGVRRNANVPVGVHDPALAGMYRAWIEQRDGDQELKIWSVMLSQNGTR